MTQRRAPSGSRVCIWGRHNTGEDLTEALKLAPHGREKVTALASAGELISATPG